MISGPHPESASRSRLSAWDRRSPSAGRFASKAARSISDRASRYGAIAPFACSVACRSGREAPLARAARSRAATCRLARSCGCCPRRRSAEDRRSSGASSLAAGHFLHLGVHTLINTARPVRIGHEVGLGTRTSIYTHGAYPSRLMGFPVAFDGVEIGDFTWVPGATINPGVRTAGTASSASARSSRAISPTGRSPPARRQRSSARTPTHGR